MDEDKEQHPSAREQLNCESHKRKRRFRTLDELQQEYNETSHSFKEELKDVLKNLKDELFSMWGLLILSALTLAILSAVVK